MDRKQNEWLESRDEDFKRRRTGKELKSTNGIKLQLYRGFVIV